MAVFTESHLQAIMSEMQTAFNNVCTEGKMPRSAVYHKNSRSILYRKRMKAQAHTKKFAFHPKIISFLVPNSDAAVPHADIAPSQPTSDEESDTVASEGLSEPERLKYNRARYTEEQLAVFIKKLEVFQDALKPNHRHFPLCHCSTVFPSSTSQPQAKAFRHCS